MTPVGYRGAVGDAIQLASLINCPAL